MTRCVIIGTPYYVCAPSPAHRLEAEGLHSETLWECSFQGVLTNEEMLQVLLDNKLWTMEEEAELNSTPQRLDAVKVDLYSRHVAFQSRRVDQCRKMLARMRKRQRELTRRRHQYDMFTQEGLAQTARMQYLVERSTRDQHNEPVDLSNTLWLLDRLLEEYTRNRPDEHDLRGLSRNPKWRMIWSSGRQEGRVFGVPSTSLTDEQQTLIAWSKLYDNVNEHMEPPPQEVIDDDDMLDGWIILEQKKREKEQRERAQGSGKGKPGAQEMYIVAETPEDAKRIEQMNDASAAFMKRQRMAVLKKGGVVGEQHMPDSKQTISLQAAQQFRDRVRQSRSKG